jgi:hypothetical protein
MYSIDNIKNSIKERPNFISNWDNVLTSAECKEIIDYFSKIKQLGLTYDRSKEVPTKFVKSDESISLTNTEIFNLPVTYEILANIVNKVGTYYEIYSEEYPALKVSSKNIYHVKLQRTKPGEGYHVWHSENDCKANNSRVAVFTLYLNTVELGGETEFLHQGVRVDAVEGRLSIFPAAFTHVHRGNPPLSGDKYILTGWIEFVD